MSLRLPARKKTPKYMLVGTFINTTSHEDFGPHGNDPSGRAPGDVLGMVGNF